MAGIEIKSADSCKWDEVSLGEVMLRLDPVTDVYIQQENSRSGKAEESTM